MKRTLLIALVLGLLVSWSAFALQELALGVALGYGNDTFSGGKFSYLNTGLYMDMYIGTENIGFVSKGLAFGFPVSASYGGIKLNMADYDGMKTAQSFMGGLGYRTNVADKVRVQGSLGVGIHQVIIMSTDYNIIDRGTLLAIGPALGLGAYYLISDQLHVGISFNGDYALAQLMSDYAEDKFKNGINVNLGLVFGFTY